MSVNSVLHTLIDVACGRQAHLTGAQADEMHEDLDPGSTAKPLNEQEAAQLASLQAKADAAAAQAAAAAAPAEVEAPAAEVTS